MSAHSLNKAHVWITRTQPGAGETAKHVSAAGFTPIIAPLLLISRPDVSPKCPTEGTLLVFTSKNGIDAFCDVFTQRDYAVVTVGQGSALHAKAAGFKTVESAQGTAESVAKYILASVSKETPIVHCAGKHVRGRIIETLTEAGFTARRDLYYRSKPVQTLPDIDTATLEAVLLHSPLAAETLSKFLPDLSTCRVISISENTDRALGALTCKARIIASAPTEAGMLRGLNA